MTKINIQIKGFTLVELMVTVAITAILLALASPNLRTIIQNNLLSTQLNELQVALSIARSEAIKRNTNTSVCKSSDGSSCTGNWQDGWIVFVDNDADGSVDLGDNDEILRVGSALSGGNSLAFSQTTVVYASSGIATSGLNGTFTFCDARGAGKAKGVIIGPTGHPRLTTDVDASGNNLACA